MMNFTLVSAPADKMHFGKGKKASKAKTGAILFVLFLLVFMFNSPMLHAQIWGPEGLNMPGFWNGWTNPPANNLALASATQVTGGRITLIPGAPSRYQTIFSVDASGADLVGGTYEWLFTSGPTDGAFNNKWAGVSVTMNSLQAYTFNTGVNNSITITNSKWYCMNWEDAGYAPSRAIFMELSEEPVTLSSLSVPADIVENQAAEITLTISAAASADEIFYLRYTTDNWVNSDVTTFNMTGTSGTATIPGQAEGKTISYYAFSSTVSGVTSDYDLYTIKLNNNGGANYSYSVAGLSSDAEILTFTLAEQTGAATINSGAATVSIEVANGTALTNLTPTITVSANASINPTSGTAQDFTNPVNYTVTAEDNSQKVWAVTVTEAAPPAPNYGLRDDGGVNLPTVTYWYSGQAVDVTEKGSEFDAKALGELTALYLKGANIKTWKSAGGDVTGATFSYKIWKNTEAEPVAYQERAVAWTSNDGGDNQTWADFGAEIEASAGLTSGTYNFKILFSISGTGVPGTTEDGPFTATFVVPEPASSEAEILTFTLAEQTGAATINSGAATVSIEVANGTALTNLTPTITVSANASINPTSGTAQDFTNPVNYTVTAEDNSQKVWAVTVTEAAPPAPNYGLRDDGGVNLPTVTYWYSGQAVDVTEKGSEFDAKALGELTALYLKGANIKTWKSAGGDVTGATFSYKIWKNTEAEPAAYQERAVSWTSNDGGDNQTWADFGAEIEASAGLTSGTYNFKILFSISGTGVPGTTEDGPFTATFVVPEPASSDAEILTFTLAEQTGAATINSGAATVSIEVANGTALTNLTPTITVSANASINPTSGTAQDFTNPVNYTVTAEDNSQKVWAVTVTEAAPPAEIVLPYVNGLRTSTAYDQLLADGFVVDNADYITAAGGYLKIFNSGYVETPLIDFTAYGLMQISFSGTTFGGVTGQTIAVEISENSGGSYTQLSSYTITSSYVTYDYVLDLSAYTSETGKLRFKMIAGTNSTRFRDLSLQETFPDPEITYANLQWPGSGSIELGADFDVYAQVYVEGITNPAGQGADVQAWIGYSTTDTDPSTWTNWEVATYNSDNGNNDEYTANLGTAITAEGTYYYASRFKYLDQAFVYGGFSGGFWDGTNNVSGVLTVSVTPPDPEIGFANLQWPASGNIELGADFDVYAQVYVEGITNPAGQGADLQAWIGYSTTDTDPSTWTNWEVATYNSDNGNNDEYTANLGTAITAEGTYYYASRFKYLDQAYVYGGFSGGFWDGTNNVSGVLTVSVTPPDPEITFANLQFPGTASILIGGNVDVYAQVEATGVTLGDTGYENLQVWIGYSDTDSDPSTWTNWYAASYNGISGITNKPEYLGNIGTDIATAGTYYYASRFQLGTEDYLYGGFDGGFWDGVNNVSGILTVSETTPDPEIGWANLQWPASGTIEPLQEFNVYGQAWIENTTGSGTATAGLQAWIGYSTGDTDPATWTTWIAADFNAASGNNDEFLANLGAEITAEGTYYYASRFKYLDQAYVYGGFSGGFWDGTNNVSGVLTVSVTPPDPEITFANLQFPGTASILIGGNVDVYAQVEATGVTLGDTGYENLQVWIGYNETDSDPSTWTNWYAASYNGISGITNKPEYLGNIGTDITTAGTYYYASRFQLGTEDYLYGGFDGGFWDGVNNVSGILTVSETTPDPEIGWANLQWPGSGTIEPLQEFNVYAQAWIDGETGSGAATAGLQTWIGYSTTDTDPATWTNWIIADFNAASGNNDEFMANLGAAMTAEGTYYYASRFKYLDQAYVYGGFSGGFWDGTNNVSGVLTVSVNPPDPEITFANLQFPGTATILIGGNVDVYAQVEATGVTLGDTGYENLQVWIGYNGTDSDPSTWTNWYAASYNGISGITNKPEYLGNIGADIATAGTYYYASRFQLGTEDYLYGGFDGGFWDGVNNVSGILTVSETTPDPEIGWANLQWPGSGTIEPLQEFNVYAQAWIDGETGSGTATTGLQAWIGYSTTDTDPATWTNWIVADFNAASGNNDEFMANLGAAMTAEGTYYYASRFKYLDQAFVYGGFSGGFWDGTNNVSGVLTVSVTPPDQEITFANLQFPGTATILIGGNVDVYAQVEATGVTLGDTGYENLQVWIGYSETDSDPSTWTSWYAASYNGISGITNKPEYLGNIGTDIATAGTYYYASRFQLGTEDYLYGGFDGGFWDGVNNVSGILTVSETTPDPEIGWANLQWPGSGTIEPLQEFNVYAQAWIDGETGSGTATAGLQAWIGYSTTDTDPATWTNWIVADFNAASGNNDEFMANLGAAMTAEGTYYYASRFKYLDQAYVYGGFSGGFWDGTNNVSGVLTVSVTPPDPEITFANLQFPGTASILIGGNVDVYAQVEATGVTLGDTGYENLQVWIGYSETDSDPSTWTNWYAASYNGISGITNKPEYLGNIGTDIATAGTYYYASRFQLGTEDYLYGGFDGGFWDGVNNVSGILTVSETTPDPEIGWANLQWPGSGTIEPLQEFNVYGQAWIENTTGSGTATAGLQAWIGYSTGDTDPATWTTWIAADFNAAVGNNDEFVGNLGSEMGSVGTYYYATRFEYLDQDYVYGGFSDGGGGFWDGINYVSGQLTVVDEVVLYPVTFAVTDATGIYENIKFKGEMTNWETVAMEQNGNVWTLTLDILPGTYEWGVIEDDGSPNGIWLIEGPNLVVTVGPDGTISGDTTYVITYVGLEESSIELSVYPNPANDRLNIDVTANSGLTTLRLIDNFGNVLFVKYLQGKSDQISLVPYASGLYTLWIQQNNHIIVKKIIKK